MALRTGHGTGTAAPVPSTPVLRPVAEVLPSDHPRHALVARLDRQAQAAVGRGDLAAAVHLLSRSARALGLMPKARRKRARRAVQ
jgi:hypothetical protein